MYKARIRFSCMSSRVFTNTTGFESVYYNESVKNLYKDMSSLAKLIKRNMSKYKLPYDTCLTFRIYNEFDETIGDRFYF